MRKLWNFFVLLGFSKTLKAARKESANPGRGVRPPVLTQDDWLGIKDLDAVQRVLTTPTMELRKDLKSLKKKLL